MNDDNVIDLDDINNTVSLLLTMALEVLKALVLFKFSYKTSDKTMLKSNNFINSRKIILLDNFSLG
jgi:hypothetical protein